MTTPTPFIINREGSSESKSNGNQPLGRRRFLNNSNNNNNNDRNDRNQDLNDDVENTQPKHHGNTIRRTFRNKNINNSNNNNSVRFNRDSSTTSNNNNNRYSNNNNNNGVKSRLKRTTERQNDSHLIQQSTAVNQWSVSPNLAGQSKLNTSTSTTNVTTTSTTTTTTTTTEAIQKEKELPVLLTMERYKELVQKYNMESDSDDYDSDEDNCLNDSDDEQQQQQYDKIFQSYRGSNNNVGASSAVVIAVDENAKEMNIRQLIKETSRGISTCLQHSPDRYLCFCGKTTDPPVDPWQTAHSCGEICQRKLNGCEHSCLLLCHPGACLPCSRTIQSKCYCGRENKVQRCKDGQFYSCENQCSKRLSCSHLCESICHKGDHPPCEKTSIKQCRCKRTSIETKCSSENICDSVCNKLLTCNKHRCTKVCCDGCDPCPLAAPRVCGCGSKQFKLDCNVPTPKSCGGTCNKLLACGHRCYNRCHTGDCTSCNQVATKKCNCGSLVKDMPCSKELICTNKCNNIRNCGRHRCRKRCCLGTDCPPCEEECGEKLGCGNHRCKATCHQGKCLPCNLTVRIYCPCKCTFIDVVCGTEKKIQPPRCKKLCAHPTTCHHSKRRRHACHFGACKPCDRICGAQLLGCTHRCPNDCHDPIPSINYRVKPLLEYKGQTIQTIPKEKAVQFPQALPLSEVRCPPCLVPMERSCIGQHEAKHIICSGDLTYSCTSECKNLLECGNHFCRGACHKVTIRRQLITEDGQQIVEESYEEEEEDNDEAENELTFQDTCQVCELPCQNERPKGCAHKCDLLCHLNDCPKCKKNVRVLCHCQSNTLLIPCFEYLESEKLERDIFSCGNVCRKFLENCNHSCLDTCHQGSCSSCKASLNVYCQCKTRKERWTCTQAKQKRLENNIKNVNFDKLLECNESCPPKVKQEKKEEVVDQQLDSKKQPTLTKEQKRIKYLEKKEEQEKKWKQEELELNKKTFADRLMEPKMIFRITITILILSFITLLVVKTKL
ncbi:hypothetical protein PPL_04762 [Heterostelium album PN500]|uniref:NF-X1-type domain-containing protein n=1 Tax=Heterostelium pallidum (strain ATCC 26659 / Pp 5 / PN500) TaxID=670386 RepID=D3B8G9_HETP5|nr:hypothetical protein PPL_04762 [Heterostelium album PN500]EFA82337.1 hypothetical protein PPL_04762 [Heterostelium album PN500]|eukprot:XP_020434454.1 hypothetical protein PPL_04762 [Heterostelium album PN500]